ncbi:class I SAM-dependent methyltransferase [Sphingosinicella sp. BN140058]|uniref:class I SAM-dependent methyltransferase n=1 Tax=Sphingosinicella sp. BN140058 TaxID=1892855 RepID=UPI0010115F40|nr:class I SAM-dependent methyltransferase [Sphingosinicella sp. BN140058]QAY79054.1 class I SAM-dependent methyltransferase [Sphingosinicella sp. BN140058]
MTRSHDVLVEQQFGPQAQAYVASAVHASGPDLDRLETIARDRSPARALDLGCGGGHAAYRIAPHGAEVVACDLSIDMLEAVAAEAARRGLANVLTCQAAAERLPFESAAFDLLVCRMSAHHWHDLDAGLREARRVLAPQGAAIFIDVVSPPHPALDTHLQTMELLRDPSHVRNYRMDEWSAALGRAGFAVQRVASHKLPLEFSAWVARMRTPPVQIDAIRALQRQASATVRDAFAISDDGSFTIPVATFELAPV